ncbi:hypothetical protein SDC9_152915 [bioreactor metagenome]|uniref:Uncharacterized protein n=1 Tax=bioreactor metagenome TaxID=1076179 RepID=A0A645EZ43_9ZZZZ
MNRAVSTPGTENQLHSRIIQRLLQVVQALFHQTTEATGFAQSMSCYYRMQPPALQYSSSIMHHITVDLSRRGKNDSFIVAL